MQILVVDDEIVSRTKLETLMCTLGQCQTAENGNQAVEMFQQALQNDRAFDLVMLDIDMPDMQGTEVLKHIRTFEKAVERADIQRSTVIMVTAQADQGYVVTCVQNGCDDYISKPFNISIIKEKLAKLGLINNGGKDNTKAASPHTLNAETMFQEISSALRKGELQLPAQPQIGIRFRELVRVNADLDEMAELLKKDMVVGSKLIRVANSVLYRGFGTIQTVEQALGRIGLSETEKMVTTITSQQLFLAQQSKYHMMLKALWEHSLASAFGAEILRHALARELNIDPYMAGLFHDIGALALIDIIAKMEKQGRYGEEVENKALVETVERYHAEFGAKLLKKWAFSDDYIHVTQYHNALERAHAHTDDLLIVHFANQVAKALGYTPFGQPPEVELIDAPSAEKLKLSGSRIATLQHMVKERMVKLGKLAA